VLTGLAGLVRRRDTQVNALMRQLWVDRELLGVD
jgi:hypothetical protein